MKSAEVDPIAARLSASNATGSAERLDWMAAQRRRHQMLRRATWCSLGAYAMMTAAALVSSLIAVWFSSQVGFLLADQTRSPPELPWTVTTLPVALLAAAVVMLVGGLVSWRFNGFPGLRAVRSALDWHAVGDATSRLLSVGCSYPEAFRSAARISQTAASRNWLIAAAERVERGSGEATPASQSGGDRAVFETLVDWEEADPAVSWQVAGEHFRGVAQRRLALLLGSVPILATIVSGLLIWMAISATLGSIWWATAQLVDGLG